MATVRLDLSFEFDPAVIGITDLDRSAEAVQEDVVKAVLAGLPAGRSLLLHALFDLPTANVPGLPDTDQIHVGAVLESYT